MAKSLLCVVNMAKRAERPKLEGFVLTMETMRTTKKTKLLAMRTANKKLQLTTEKSSLAMDRNIKAGRENVPTNVFKPFASAFEMTSSLPAMYLNQTIKRITAYIKRKCALKLEPITHPHKMMPKHCTNARYKLSMGVAASLAAARVSIAPGYYVLHSLGGPANSHQMLSAKRQDARVRHTRIITRWSEIEQTQGERDKSYVDSAHIRVLTKKAGRCYLALNPVSTYYYRCFHVLLISSPQVPPNRGCSAAVVELYSFGAAKTK